VGDDASVRLSLLAGVLLSILSTPATSRELLEDPLLKSFVLTVENVSRVIKSTKEMQIGVAEFRKEYVSEQPVREACARRDQMPDASLRRGRPVTNGRGSNSRCVWGRATIHIESGGWAAPHQLVSRM